MSGVVAIMQPTYLPWIGYFALMERVETFVFLDDVQFEKRSWQQRNRIKSSTGEIWLTVPVLSKGKFAQTIADVRINPDSRFPQDHLGSIRANYARAPHFGALFDALQERYAPASDRLLPLNISLIEWIAGLLGVRTPSIRSSSLGVADTKADRLVAICRKLGATRYLSPPGSAAYLEGDTAFDAAGIELAYHDYEHPVYPQLHGDFVSHLSALDLVMNTGSSARDIMLSGVSGGSDAARTEQAAV